MSDLSLESAGLRSSAALVERARDELAATRPALREAANLVGHPALAARIRDIADDLDLGRLRFDSRLEVLAAAVTTIAEAFEGVDAQLSLGTADVRGGPRTAIAGGR